MAGYGGGRGGGGRKSGGSSVAAGRKAQQRYKMSQANARFKKSSLPGQYSPRNTRRGGSPAREGF